MKKGFVLVLLFISCMHLVYSQENKSDLDGNLWSDIKKDGVKMWGGLKHTYTQPLRWKKKDWLTFGGVAAGTVILYMYDEQTSEYFIEQGETAPNFLKQFGWYYGSPQNFFMITSGIYAYGLLAKNDAWRDAGILIVTSAVASGFIQTITKNVVGRARPSEGVGSNVFKPFSREGSYHSFPSGHTMLSITASHAIAKQFDNLWVKGGIYAVGLIAPISRLWEGAHWLTDVVLGGVISIVVVDSIDNYFHKNDMYLHKKEKMVSWNLKAGVGTIGVVGTF
ncbi:phosphatase PAP2 family protein [Lutibacter holmesii]|uniref:Phosphatase PAP2 family protein n=1 Tax=Lutibacter holmesii TaxID=1137985 RepID=A0ABW3WQX4_9FLAO